MKDLIASLSVLAVPEDDHEGWEVVTEAIDEIERLRLIETAARNLIAQKGRHNTEIAYKKLEEVLK